MKTTVEFDNDVALRLSDLRRERNVSLRFAINSAMREWLAVAHVAAPRPLKRWQTGADSIAPKIKTRFESPVLRGGKWLVPEGLHCIQDIFGFCEISRTALS